MNQNLSYVEYNFVHMLVEMKTTFTYDIICFLYNTVVKKSRIIVKYPTDCVELHLSLSLSNHA